MLPNGRVLESRLSDVQQDGCRRPEAPPHAGDRHRDGIRAPRPADPGRAHHLRDGPPCPHRHSRDRQGEAVRREADGGARRRSAQGGEDHRRAPSRAGLPAGGRIHAIQRGGRLRAEATAAPSLPLRTQARARGAVPPRAHTGRRQHDGRGLPRARSDAAEGDDVARTGGEAVRRDPRARPGAADDCNREGEGRGARRAPWQRGLPAVRHLRAAQGAGRRGCRGEWACAR